MRKRLNDIYVKHTGQPIEAIERKLERDSYMSAEESRDFGLVDEVVESRQSPNPPIRPSPEASKLTPRLEVSQPGCFVKADVLAAVGRLPKCSRSVAFTCSLNPPGIDRFAYSPMTMWSRVEYRGHHRRRTISACSKPLASSLITCAAPWHVRSVGPGAIVAPVAV
jgi:Clp protease